MPKASFTFDLSDPDDREEFRLLNKAHELRAALSELYSRFRAHEKYGSEPVTFELFLQILTDLNIDLADI